MAIDRRGFSRLHVVWKATLTRLNGEQFPGSTDNVSQDGLNVIVDCSLVLGEPIKVDLVSPCRGRTCFFRLDGVVVYDKPLGNNLGRAVGLRLLEADPNYLRLVRQLEAGEAEDLAS
ncbi:PilZ domain-containing protein [Motiliproteus sp. SC1-56]|uniref:PilZ domain-containing protein n=1 Tax=Motiliproteus sp. SC1-56 TaxID=2799565 RepID=UPI001A8DE59F|nr:PilZ domain-containing protein [Motiliproteus sp. SC1-56]